MLVFREAQGVESLDSSLAPNILISGSVMGATRLTWRVLPVSNILAILVTLLRLTGAGLGGGSSALGATC